jgi:hypothetical protein
MRRGGILIIRAGTAESALIWFDLVLTAKGCEERKEGKKVEGLSRLRLS